MGLRKNRNDNLENRVGLSYIIHINSLLVIIYKMLLKFILYFTNNHLKTIYMDNIT